MSEAVVIVDYGMGNLNSVKRKISQLKVNVEISADPNVILAASKLILPGVGHFGMAMNNLTELGLLDALNEAVLVRKTPILGICLGMQLMATRSDEGDSKGLGWIDAEIVKFAIQDTLRHKIPHTGWNQVEHKKASRIMQNIPDHSEFYFVHAFHMKVNDPSDTLHETAYETVFPSAIEKGNIFGVQYHPEKSHDIGKQLLKNFIEL